MGRFTDKVVLITGSGMGLGQSMAEEFAREGAKLALVDINETANLETQRLISKIGAQSIGLVGDVSKREFATESIDKVVSEFGRLDIAVNNAAVDHAPQPFCAIDDGTFNQVIDVNIRGVWLFMQAELNAMEAQGVGAIVNVTSVTAHVGGPQMSLYTASKHAVLGLTRSASLDYASKGIRINCVSPGGINTPMFAQVVKANPEYAEMGRAAHPMGRVAEMQEIARAAMFLASDEASFVTGQALLADGGYTTA